MNEEQIKELIAERERLNRIIESYQTQNGELSAVVKSGTPKAYSFEDMLSQSLMNGEFDDGVEELSATRTRHGISITRNVTVNSPVKADTTVNINIDNSVHTTTHNEHHTSATLAGGDKVIDALGGILHNLIG